MFSTHPATSIMVCPAQQRREAGVRRYAAIALGRVWHDLEGSLAALPTERAEAEVAAPVATDELAARRAARNAI